MTITSGFDATVAALSRGEAKILAHFASGESVDQIAASTQLSRGEVALAVETVAKGSRNLAQNMVTAWQRANPDARANGSPVPSLPAITMRQPPARDAVGDLLSRAAASEVPRLVRLADKVQELVDQLRVQIGEHERGQQLRDEAAELESRLAAIRRQLGSKRAATPSAPATAPAAVPESRAIRAWAAANGVACPDRGRVPIAVVSAYREAVGDA